MKLDAKVKKWVDSYGDWFLEEELLQMGRMTKEKYPYKELFSPVEINSITVKNRVVMAPMGNISMCDETGRPNEKMLAYFFERAKGGVGLITSGLVPVSHGIDNSITEQGELTYFPRIDRSRSVFAGWRDLADGIHAFGSRFFIQLTAGLGRVGNPQCLLWAHKLPNSASWNPNFYMPQIPCQPLTDGQARRIIKNMGQAAADAKAAGIDGVYLHGHEGYLLEQMTNPAFNRRKTGAFANWQAFGLQSVQEIRRRTGERYPIMYRIDLSLALNETYGAEGMKEPPLKKFKNGRTIAMTLEYMENLVGAGVDLFDVDLGCYDNWWLPHPPASMPPGCFLEVSRLVKRHFEAKDIRSNAGKKVSIVAVGKLGYPDLAETALRRGDCDMVMLGRPLLADPMWCNKAYAGAVEEIRPCIGCQEGCINEFVEGGHPQCAVNPRTAFEHRYPAQLTPADKSKKIAVVGAGPAGIEAALTAAKRGHEVHLFEKEGDIGGKIRPGSVPKIKYELNNYRLYLDNQVKQMEKEKNFTFHKNTPFTKELLKKETYDVAIFASGTKETMPPWPGQDQLRLVTATQLLQHPALLQEAQHVVVIGGGVVGCETAYYLAYEKNCRVTVVEMEKYFMNHVCTANRGHLIYYMRKKGVRLLNCCRVTGFSAQGVQVMRNLSSTVPNPYNTWSPILPENVPNPLETALKVEEVEELLAADLAVIAVGEKRDDALFYEIQKEALVPEIYTIGDSFAPGKVLEAVRAGYALGWNV